MSVRVLLIFGTRPEAIKLAPVVHEMKSHQEQFDVKVCVTGQHRDMLDQVLNLFTIEPDFDLNLMRPDQTPSQLTSSMLRELENVLSTERPDWVIVQGDTTTAMAAALAGFYAKTRVAHVEAGLRTGNKSEPFPEEVNRRIVSAVADLHFAPTCRAHDNLISERIDPSSVVMTGNTVIDALFWMAEQSYDRQSSPLADIPQDRRIVLVTAHRRESFGAPLRNICRAIAALAYEYPDDMQIVWPVHPNPNVEAVVHRLLTDVANVSLLPPLTYQPFVRLLQESHIVLTDSGGVQEEAPAYGKPVLVLRKTTERPEAVEAGVAKLVGTDTDRIVKAARRLLDDPTAYATMAQTANPFGDGNAAQRICQALTNWEGQASWRQ